MTMMELFVFVQRIDLLKNYWQAFDREEEFRLIKVEVEEMDFFVEELFVKLENHSIDFVVNQEESIDLILD